MRLQSIYRETLFEALWLSPKEPIHTIHQILNEAFNGTPSTTKSGPNYITQSSVATEKNIHNAQAVYTTEENVAVSDLRFFVKNTSRADRL
jgi:hypothetical protein